MNFTACFTNTHTHNPHTQLIHYSHPSAMVGSKNTVIAHTGAHCEVRRKLLHNVTYEGYAKQLRFKYASLSFKTEGCGQISLSFVPAAICGHDGGLGFEAHFSCDVTSDPTEWFA